MVTGLSQLNSKCTAVHGVGKELSLRTWDSRKSLEGELIPRVCAHIKVRLQGDLGIVPKKIPQKDYAFSGIAI